MKTAGAWMKRVNDPGSLYGLEGEPCSTKSEPCRPGKSQSYINGDLQRSVMDESEI